MLNKQLGIDNEIVRKSEGIFNGFAKFGWGAINGVGFIGKTIFDSAALDGAAIGNKLGIVSDNTVDGYKSNAKSNFDLWKQVPGGIVNGVVNIVDNTPRLFTNPNMSIKEVSNLTNDIINTGFLAKGTYDVTTKVGSVAKTVIPKVQRSMNVAMDTSRISVMKPSVAGIGETGAFVNPIDSFITREKPLGWEREEEIEAALDAERKSAKSVILPQATKSPSFWLILVVGTIFAGLSIGFATFVPSFWQEEGMDPVKSAYLITIYSLVATVATIASGKIADKFGNRVFVTYLHLALIAAMVCAVLSKGNLSPIFVVGSILFAAIAFPIYTTIIATITSEIFGSLDYEKITGVFMAGLYIGLCLVSPICGYIHDTTGSFSPAFVFLGVAAIISLICTLTALRLSPMKKVINN